MPMFGNPLPWKKTAETPNLGKIDSDRRHAARPRLVGVAHLQDFVSKGGLLLTATDTAELAVTFGLHAGRVDRARQR